MRWPLLLLVLVGISDAAPRKKEPTQPAKLDDPCTDASCKRKALDGFRAAFAQEKAGKLNRPLRISYFGDSLIASDHIVNGLRERFAALLGKGGPGFVFAASPHPYNQHQVMQRYVSGSWQIHGASSSVPIDRLLGLGGSAEGNGSIRFVPATPVTVVDVHYLEQKSGGTVDVIADGKLVESFSTAGEAKRAAYKRVAFEPSRKVELRVAKGRVRLFGASLETAKGVVVDNLGIVNATAKGMARYNMADHLKGQLAHRSSDLVIVMYGTNEAEWLAPKGQGMVEHEQVFKDLLSSIRAANPDGSCLVVSPLDQLDWHKENAPPRESIPAMVEAQHRAATANGCAFWNTFEWMGGKGASGQWFRRGLVIKDFQHPTSEGAAKIAEALFLGLAP